MDVRRADYWGILTLNGKTLALADNMCLRGSVMSLVGEMLKSLTSERTRLTPDGDMEIVLRIRNKPTDTSILILGKAEEVGALLDSHESDQPLAGEEYGEFYDRLIANDYPAATAEYLAAQWFDREVNPHTTLWLNDPKAIRFRELNSRDEAYEAALPSEYESLKHYVQTTYADFVEGLVFRTA